MPRCGPCVASWPGNGTGRRPRTWALTASARTPSRSIQQGRKSMARNWRAGAGGNASFALLVVSMVTGLFTHAFHVTRYPLILTDECIYVQQAWSLVNEGRLSHYTS